MAVNIKAAMKRDERELNGLESIASDLVDQPLTRRVVVGIIEVARVTTDFEDGSAQVPTVKFVQIEPLAGDAAKQAQDLLAASYKARTGQQVEETLFDHATDGEPAGDGDQGTED